MVVDLHGGRVVVNSEEGQGSSFTIHLPVKGASPVKVWSPLEPETVPAAAGPAPLISEPPSNSQPSSQKVLSKMSERTEG
jgi:hypothetical protein